MLELWGVNGVRYVKHLKSIACKMVQWVRVVSKPDDLSWIPHDPQVRKRELTWADGHLMSRGAHDMHWCVLLLVHEHTPNKINKRHTLKIINI